jgi:phage FluMu protein Com
VKRIITCPKCEAKLAVFDLGKPINQKCPKCGNAFVVESEESQGDAKDGSKPEASAQARVPGKVEEPEKEEVAQPADGPQKKDEAPAAPADANPAPDVKTEAAAKDKEIKLKKPEERPAAKLRAAAKSEPSLPAAPAEQEVPVAGGPSPLFAAVVVGLLVLVIVLQVMTKLRADKQYGVLIDHLKFIETKLAK